jgi:peptidoglycan/xylan/chitin deacetylase (PgdA/CDA1 family)
MKRFHLSGNLMDKLRQGTATIFACSVVVLVPLLSFAQLGHVHIGQGRKATALPVFQTRAVDKVDKPVRLFTEPLISVTYDDGWETTYADAMPLLQKNGIHSTQYLLSGTATDSQYLSWEQITAMKNAGHEIGCHTVNHPDLRTIDNSQLKYQVSACKEVMTKRFGVTPDFASPYGSADQRTISVIKQYFASQRNTNGDPANGVTDADVNTPEGYDGKGFNPYNIIGVTINRDTTVDQIKQLISFAQKHNGWVVITYHQAESGGSKWAVDKKSMEEQLETISKSPLRVVTVKQALAGWKAQQ